MTGRLIFLALLLAAMPGLAAEPSAIVEQVSDLPQGPKALEFLSPGRVIRLQPGQRLVVGYFRSCWRETISGGQVTIGKDRSTIVRGRVFRQLVECDRGHLWLTGVGLGEAGKTTARALKRKKQMSAPGKAPRVFSRTPIFWMVKKDAIVTLKRLDRAGAIFKITARGHFADLAKGRRRLITGGLYRASAGGSAVHFRIDELAEESGGPIVGRIVFVP
ncbi:MAG: hypothetical protein V3S44_02710 [Alphaproteobacteria bacterium]